MFGEHTAMLRGISARSELVLQRYGLVSEKFSRGVHRLAYSKSSRVAIDGILVSTALCASYLLRFDGQLPSPFHRQLPQLLPFAVSLSLASNVLTRTYTRVWRFFGFDDAVALAKAVAIAFALSVVWRTLDRGAFAGTVVPFGVLLIYPFLALGSMITGRLIRRVVHNRTSAAKEVRSPAVARKRLLLVGAGEAGLYLLRELRKTDFEVVGFVDDGPELQGRTIGGWRVLGTTRELAARVRTHHVDEVVLCIPSAPKTVLQRIVAECAKVPVKTSTVPAMWEILSGKVTLSRLRPVNMEDLLGRDTIHHPQDASELTRAYHRANILVTGAGGSIGSELIRQLQRFQPSQLILLDKDENSLYEMACELKETFDSVVEIVADVRNRELMERLFALHRPEVVFHAAAYKHVPLMESYPAEAILNNVIGTKHVAELSNQFGVKMFVLISTDKAVNPSSTMGASKRVAELIVQKIASSGTTTRFCCVRFGNVLGSRASVVPIFQRQIRQGKNITVTHPDVRRYFMTIPEAVQLVIQTGSLGKAGEIFLLDMGDPVKIVDLARNLIELSGLVPDKDVTIQFTGLRPGEKLNEELLISGERGARSTKYSKIFVVEALQRNWPEFDVAVNELEQTARAGETDEIHGKLSQMNIGYYNPHLRRRRCQQATRI